MSKKKPTAQLNFLSINDSCFWYAAPPTSATGGRTPCGHPCPPAACPGRSSVPPSAGPRAACPGGSGNTPEHGTLHARPGRGGAVRVALRGSGGGEQSRGTCYGGGADRPHPQSHLWLPCNRCDKSWRFSAHAGGHGTSSQRRKSIGSAGLTRPFLMALRGTHCQPKPPPPVSTAVLLGNVCTRQCPLYSPPLHGRGRLGLADKLRCTGEASRRMAGRRRGGDGSQEPLCRGSGSFPQGAPCGVCQLQWVSFASSVPAGSPSHMSAAVPQAFTHLNSDFWAFTWGKRGHGDMGCPSKGRRPCGFSRHMELGSGRVWGKAPARVSAAGWLQLLIAS